MKASVEVNITVQIDAGSSLSLGRHFLSILTYTIYEQQNASKASGVLVGSVKPITVNFTIKECKWIGLTLCDRTTAIES